MSVGDYQHKSSFEKQNLINEALLIAKKLGKAIRFPEKTVRPMGRTAAGVKGVTLESDEDEVIGMVCVNPNSSDTTILVLSEKGYGKRTELRYTTQKRL